MIMESGSGGACTEFVDIEGETRSRFLNKSQQKEVKEWTPGGV